MNRELENLSTVWKDPVEGSWWKSIVIIVTYFAARIGLETFLFNNSLVANGVNIDEINYKDTAEVTKYLGMSNELLLISSIILLALILLMAKWFKFKLFDVKNIQLKKILWTLKIYMIFLVIYTLIAYLIQYLDPGYQNAQNQIAVEAMTKNMSVIVAFLYIVVITPITEEILFRGLLMKYMFPITPYIGALISSLVFAGLHMADFSIKIDFLLYYSLSVALTYVYWRTRKLEYSIMYHMIHNGLAFMIMQLY